MKRTAILGSIVAIGVIATAVAAQQGPGAGGPGGPGGPGGGARRPAGGGLPPVSKIEKITDSLYKIGGAGGNTTVFITQTGVVLVDTKLANNGQAILDQVRTVTDKPVQMIINTHSHPDHNGSNSFFKNASPNIDIVGHANIAKWMQAGPRVDPATIPTKSYTDRMSLLSGKDKIDLYYFGRGHTDNDSFVVFPSQRTMNIGDLMAWNMAPLIDPGANGSIVELPNTIDKAAATIKGVDRVIEGHGNVNTWAGMKLYSQFMRSMVDESRKAIARNDTPESVVAILQKNPKYAVFLGTQMLHDLEYGGTPLNRANINVRVAFQELSGERVTTNFSGALPATAKHKGSADWDPNAPAPRGPGGPGGAGGPGGPGRGPGGPGGGAGGPPPPAAPSN